jgi:hypothetical protein
LGERVAAADDLTGDDPDLVHDQALDRALDVEHLELEAVAGDEARVAVLAAGFGIERGAIEDQLDGLARTGRRDLDAVAQQRANPRIGGELVIAGERGGPGLAQLSVGRDVGMTDLLRPGVGLGPVALLGH